MQSPKKLMKRKDVEQLENTSLAAIGLLDTAATEAPCANVGISCYCNITVIQCCGDSSLETL